MSVTIDDTEKQPPSFEVWGIDVDHRPPSALAAYVRCRVPLAFENERLVPAAVLCK